MEIASLLAAPSATSTPADNKMTAIDSKAQDFEAMVLSQLLAPMFDTIKSEGLFGGDGPEQDAFNSMLHDEYAKALAARGGVGIADEVKDALLRLQSERNRT